MWHMALVVMALVCIHQDVVELVLIMDFYCVKFRSLRNHFLWSYVGRKLLKRFWCRKKLEIIELSLKAIAIYV